MIGYTTSEIQGISIPNPETCTIKELMDTGKKLAESYLKGDDPCLGIPRKDVQLIYKDFAIWKPYIPLQVSPVMLKA